MRVIIGPEILRERCAPIGAPTSAPAAVQSVSTQIAAIIAVHEMNDRTDDRGDREDCVRRRGCDVLRKSEDGDHERDVDDSAADAEQAGNKADNTETAIPNRKLKRHSYVWPSRSTSEREVVPNVERGARMRAEKSATRRCQQNAAESDIEDVARNESRRVRSEDRSRNRGKGEERKGSQIDAHLPPVRKRARRGVCGDDCERERSDRLRRPTRLNDDQRRDK